MRPPPHSVEAEQSTIGAVLRDSSIWPDIAWLPADAFYDRKHGRIWNAIRALKDRGEPIDVLTTFNKMLELGWTDESIVGDLAEIFEEAPTPSNAYAYARIVQDHSFRRMLISLGRDLSDAAHEGEREKIAEALAKIGRAEFPLAGQTFADAIEMRATRWLWRHWLPRGVLTLFAAPGGTGKGIFWCHLVACVTNRRSWPDGTVTEPEDVAIYSPEDDPERELAPRLEANGADRSRVRILKRFDEVDGAAQKAALVVLDPIAHGAKIRDNNQTADVRPYVERIHAIANGSGAAFLGIHHFNKYANQRAGCLARDLVLGSTSWVDASRWVLLLARDRSCPNGSRVLIRAKANIGSVDYSQGAFRLQGERKVVGDDAGTPIESIRINRLEYVEGNADEMLFAALQAPKESRPDSLEDQVMSVVREVAPATVYTVVENAKAHGIAPRTTHKHIGRLHSNGSIVRRRMTPDELAEAKERGAVSEKAHTATLVELPQSPAPATPIPTGRGRQPTPVGTNG